MQSEDLPSISVIIPTLNSQKFLPLCLQSIRSQRYPQKKIEIIIIDGGSIDDTLSISRKFSALISKNPQMTAETGKAIGIKQAKGQLIALIDSDNILPDNNWLTRMVVPFNDYQIIGAEPWAFSYNRNMGFIDRYCSLIGANDPICLFMGNYDRMSLISGTWTNLKIKTEDKGSWIKIFLNAPYVPTIGANGTIYRSHVIKTFLDKEVVNNYFVDVDLVNKLAEKNTVIFAKVKNGIIHYYCGNKIGKFISKQNRRINDFLYHQNKGERSNSWQKVGQKGILKFIIYSLLVVPFIYQTIKGYRKKNDPAWLFHPVACYLTLGIYGWGKMKSIFGVKEPGRKNWGQ